MRRGFLLSSLLLLTACTPMPPVVDSAPVTHVESAFGETVPGTWIVIVDGTPLAKDVTLNGAFCSQTDAYALDIRPAFTSSVLDTFRPLAADVRAGTLGAAVPRGTTGVIHVRADAMRLTTQDIANFWGYGFETTIAIDMSFAVDDAHGRLLTLKATGTGKSRGSSGLLCDSGGPIFATAARNAIIDGLQHFAVEFASNRGVHTAYDNARQQASATMPGERD